MRGCERTDKHIYVSIDTLVAIAPLRGEVSKSIDGIMLIKPALDSFIAYAL